MVRGNDGEVGVPALLLLSGEVRVAAQTGPARPTPALQPSEAALNVEDR